MSAVNTQGDLETFSLTKGILRRGKYGACLLYGHQSLYWYACVNKESEFGETALRVKTVVRTTDLT
jgi:hypothetical protein